MYCIFSQDHEKAKEEAEEEDEEEDEDLGYADTYAEYMPSKCKSSNCLSFDLINFVRHFYTKVYYG